MSTEPQQQLVYVSRALEPIDEKLLDSILEIARAHNQANAVTGMLLYGGNHFLQLIEGSSSAIESTWKHISRDPRHTILRLLGRRTIIERLCGEWSMGAYRSGDLAVLAASEDANAHCISTEGMPGKPTIAERLITAAIWAKRLS